VGALENYMKKEHLDNIELIGKRGSGLRSIRVGIGTSKPDVINPTKLSLRDWAGIFEILADPDQKGHANLNMKKFLELKWPKLNMSDLSGLIPPFKEIQVYRNNVAHWHPPRPHIEDVKELKRMRNLVLGINGTSVIIQLYQLLAAKGKG
jgi:hypothetical protein